MRAEADVILKFWRDQPRPSFPKPNLKGDESLTNLFLGLGDTMMLTDVPRAAAKAGRIVPVFSGSDHFSSLMAFNPYWRDAIKIVVANAPDLVRFSDCGNGHYLQRIRRAYGLPVDDKPRGCLEKMVIPPRDMDRCVLHFEPGRHAIFQRKNVHPRARMLYPETKLALEQFIASKRGVNFIAIGHEDPHIRGARYYRPKSTEDVVMTMAQQNGFIGIPSGPMHVAAALGIRSICVVNFPHPSQIILPTMVATNDIVESEWLYPQNVHLHQELDGPLVRKSTYENFHRAWNGEVYPFWSEEFLPLIHEKAGKAVNVPFEVTHEDGETYILQLGRLGDIINVLPCARAIHAKTQKKPKIVVCEEYACIFDRITYAEPIVWKGGLDDSAGALAMPVLKGKRVINTMTWGNAPFTEHGYRQNFLQQQWATLGFDGQFGTLPVVFDKRDTISELAACSDLPPNHGSSVVLNMSGITSKCPDPEWLMGVLKEAIGDSGVLDISDVHLDNPIDMVGFLESADLLITVDSAPLHINRATRTPCIHFGKSDMNMWQFSGYVENVVACWTYDEMKAKRADIIAAIRKVIEPPKPLPTVTFVTLADDNFKELGDLCERSFKRYDMGCGFLRETELKDKSRSGSWNKVLALWESMVAVEDDEVWMVWVDCDCVLLRPFPIREFLRDVPSDKHMVFTTDWNGLCMCCFALRCNTWSQRFLESLWFLGDAANEERFGRYGAKWEQNATKVLLQNFPALSKHVMYIGNQWCEADTRKANNCLSPILHYGGVAKEERLKQLKKALGER